MSDVRIRPLQPKIPTLEMPVPTHSLTHTTLISALMSFATSPLPPRAHCVLSAPLADIKSSTDHPASALDDYWTIERQEFMIHLAREWKAANNCKKCLTRTWSDVLPYYLNRFPFPRRQASDLYSQWTLLMMKHGRQVMLPVTASGISWTQEMDKHLFQIASKQRYRSSAIDSMEWKEIHRLFNLRFPMAIIQMKLRFDLSLKRAPPDSSFCKKTRVKAVKPRAPTVAIDRSRTQTPTSMSKCDTPLCVMFAAGTSVNQIITPIAAVNPSAAHPLSALFETIKLAGSHDATDSGLDPSSPVYRSFRHLPSHLVKLLRSSNLSGLFAADPSAGNDQSVIGTAAEEEQASKRRRTASQFTFDNVFEQSDIAVKCNSTSPYLIDSSPVFDSCNESLITSSSVLTPRALARPDDDREFVAHRMH